MKKAFVFLSLAVLLAMVFASCKTHERCPAYGKHNQSTEKTKPV